MTFMMSSNQGDRECCCRMTAVIIAGGQSRRMQRDKALIKVGDLCLIEYVLRALTPLFSEVFINANSPETYACFGVPVIQDLLPNIGPLGGIHTALTTAATEYVFCVACDMPLLQPPLIRLMQQRVIGYDALVPHTPDGFHPLHAIYATRCLGEIEKLLHERLFKVAALFPRVNTIFLEEREIRNVDPNLYSFLNLNTQEEFETFQQFLLNITPDIIESNDLL